MERGRSGRLWRAAWSFLELQEEPGDTVIDDLHQIPGASWFPEGRVSFAGTILREADDRPAIRARGEHQAKWHSASVGAVARDGGRRPRPCGKRAWSKATGSWYLPNIPETIVAMLAASTLGAIWSSCSPDFGVRGVLDRFERLDPNCLCVVMGMPMAASIDCRPRTAEILEALAKTAASAPKW